MREGGKKNIKKKNIEPIFGNVKNIGQITRKVNEGDGLKNNFDPFRKTLMRATKKTSKTKT